MPDATPDPPNAPADARAAFGFLTRRRMLAWSLAGMSAALTASSAGLWALGGGSGAPVAALRGISRRHYATLAALVEVSFPPHPAYPAGVAARDLPRQFDDFLAAEPAQNVRDLRLALTLLEYGPLLFEGRWIGFSRLTPDDRRAHWAAWATAASITRRKVSVAFRRFLNTVFYDHESVWPALGYAGPSLALRLRAQQGEAP